MKAHSARSFAPEPVTRWRLEQLELALRCPLVPGLHLTPGGAMEEHVHRTLRERDAREAEHIRSRLARVGGLPTCAFERAGMRVRSRWDFVRAATTVEVKRERSLER